MNVRYRLLGLVCLGLLLSSLYAVGQYRPDILGGGYEQRMLTCCTDGGDTVRSVLVRKRAARPTDDALFYLHGYNDYFFQSALGDTAVARGMDFYALDLHGYGRSLPMAAEPFYCRDLAEYFPELDSALAVVRAEGHRRVVIMGHSTGGLIMTYYLYRTCSPERCADIVGLVLNSPFLDWNLTSFQENVLMPVVSAAGRLFPRWKVQGGGHSFYSDALLKEHWTFDTNWKKPEGYVKRAGWLRAIHRAQRELQHGVELSCPVLVLSSDSSAWEKGAWQEDFRRKDIVLDVADIQRYGRRLGERVECRTIPGGMHDLVLSAPEARDEFYRVCFQWIEEILQSAAPSCK
ncbi:MAG: alpha/beta hydrolase [Bacteroidaceae bacterium]|jgi:alpha-beta hydrolase superfamily lysophospholipase